MPILLNVTQIWSLTTKLKNNIEICQRKMVRKILGVSTRDKIFNTQLQEWSMLKSAVQQASRSKRKWAGYVPRLHHARDRISNTQLQEWSMLKSAAQQASRSKRKWAGYVPRLHHTRDRISNTQLQEWSMLKSAVQQASRSKRKFIQLR